MVHSVNHNIKTLQPHSGAIIMALYHYLKFPEFHNFGVRLTYPFSKVYHVELSHIMKDEWVFRTGKDWPCYSRVYPKANFTEFRLRHDHSSVEEEFRIEGRRLYFGRLRTEAGLYVQFQGDFLHPKFVQLIEEYRLPDGTIHYPKREYQIDVVW
ncbi:MAG: hypothetical protein UY13_C0002G0227 [Candidatus Pacebacteria bacterium GW2011_GWB1_47_8]|nr:MAG: hypothetical protein UX28_C0001G0375 [Candidatus Pacebacteria bacterium GW2011_GWA1_46_10]KKU84315.1 MAG: hypothetical protein UY13_C0002G0227 [Candidatus Pacebacteria bacterium GW2011_GWB1_47_8]HCR81259.1 hypothetical protein [Candidatus Paceibacterota bacterium]